MPAATTTTTTGEFFNNLQMVSSIEGISTAQTTITGSLDSEINSSTLTGTALESAVETANSIVVDSASSGSPYEIHNSSSGYSSQSFFYDVSSTSGTSSSSASVGVASANAGSGIIYINGESNTKLKVLLFGLIGVALMSAGL